MMLASQTLGVGLKDLWRWPQRLLALASKTPAGLGLGLIDHWPTNFEAKASGLWKTTGFDLGFGLKASSLDFGFNDSSLNLFVKVYYLASKTSDLAGP